MFNFSDLFAHLQDNLFHEHTINVGSKSSPSRKQVLEHFCTLENIFGELFFSFLDVPTGKANILVVEGGMPFVHH